MKGGRVKGLLSRPILEAMRPHLKPPAYLLVSSLDPHPTVLEAHVLPTIMSPTDRRSQSQYLSN